MSNRTESLSPDLDAIGDWTAPEGSEPWAKALRIGLQRCVDKVSMYPDEMRKLVDKAMTHAAWTKLISADGQPFPTFEMFCATRRPHGLGTPYATIEPYLVAAHGGDRTVVAALTTRSEAAPTAGGKRPGAGRPLPIPEGCTHVEPPKISESDANIREVRTKNQRHDHNADSRTRGDSPAYLAARIARDAPAVHEEMKAGKYPSVRAAAKAAGIVKDPNPVTTAARAVSKVPTARLAEFVAALSEEAARMLLVCLRDRLGVHR